MPFKKNEISNPEGMKPGTFRHADILNEILNCIADLQHKADKRVAFRCYYKAAMKSGKLPPKEVVANILSLLGSRVEMTGPTEMKIQWRDGDLPPETP